MNCTYTTSTNSSPCTAAAANYGRVRAPNLIEHVFELGSRVYFPPTTTYNSRASTTTATAAAAERERPPDLIEFMLELVMHEIGLRETSHFAQVYQPVFYCGDRSFSLRHVNKQQIVTNTTYTS